MKENATSELSAMKALIDDFHWTTLSDLRNAIDSLDMRALRIQGTRPQWDREFRKAWGALEEVYAVMKDRGESSPNEALHKIIVSSIEKLKAILVTQLRIIDNSKGVGQF